MAISSRFIPKNPRKYIGDPTKIMSRSTWELVCMKFFDSSSAILQWGSEEVIIPYVSPIDGLIHRYYPDFIVVYTDKNGAIQKEILEIKPKSQSLIEHAKSNRDKAALIVNNAKWMAASIFCQQRGMTFRVITELSLFKQPEKKPKMVKKAPTVRRPSKPKGTGK